MDGFYFSFCFAVVSKFFTISILTFRCFFFFLNRLMRWTIDPLEEPFPQNKKIIVIKDLIWITQSCIIDCGLDNNAVSLLNILILVSYFD